MNCWVTLSKDDLSCGLSVPNSIMKRLDQSPAGSICPETRWWREGSFLGLRGKEAKQEKFGEGWRGADIQHLPPTAPRNKAFPRTWSAEPA